MTKPFEPQKEKQSLSLDQLKELIKAEDSRATFEGILAENGLDPEATEEANDPSSLEVESDLTEDKLESSEVVNSVNEHSDVNIHSEHAKVVDDNSDSSNHSADGTVTEANIESPKTVTITDNPVKVDTKLNLAPKKDKLTEEEVKSHIMHQLTGLTPKENFPREIFAGFWIRTVAFLIDYFFVYLIHQIFWGLAEGHLPQILTNDPGRGLINLLIFCLYFSISSAITRGQTMGRIFCGLRVVDLNQEKLSQGMIFIREFFGSVILYYAAWTSLILVFTEYKQNLTDLLLNTSMVNERYLQACQKWLEI